MTSLALYVLLVAALFYALGFAKITDPMRSRMPIPVQRWLWCPYCAGFWYGVVLGATLGRYQEISFLGLPALWWGTPVVVGSVTMVLNAVVTATHLRHFDWTVGYLSREDDPAGVHEQVAAAQSQSGEIDTERHPPRPPLRVA